MRLNTKYCTVVWMLFSPFVLAVSSYALDIPYQRLLQTPLSWSNSAKSDQTQSVLRYESEYPKISAHGEWRTRFHVSRETIDLGTNPQPIVRNIPTIVTVLGLPTIVDVSTTVDPKDNAATGL